MEKNLGNDLNWTLSFDNLREKDTTKHVRRLHPYKGKYIPQLVEYFIDKHTDDFKKEAYFKAGDIILDPFLGSGTTLIQSLEMGIHSVGIDVSEFNCMIASCKAARYDYEYLQKAIKKMLAPLNTFEHDNKIEEFENELLVELARFNGIHFPGYNFKYKINQGNFNEAKFSIEKETDIGKVANLLTPLLNEVISARKDNSDFDFGSGLQYYCEIYGSGLSCVLLEWNIGGWRLIAVGDENLLENIGSLERGEVFTFLIAPKS